MELCVEYVFMLKQKQMQMQQKGQWLWKKSRKLINNECLEIREIIQLDNKGFSEFLFLHFSI